MNRKHYVVIGLIAILALFVGSALAAPPSPIATLLARGTVGTLDAEHQGVEVQRDGSADHVVAKVTFPPGSKVDWHKHPGVVLVTVASGRVQHIESDCERETFETGESFVEDGNVHLVRNLGTKEAVVYATWILPTRTPSDGLTIPVDAPEGCSVQ